MKLTKPELRRIESLKRCHPHGHALVRKHVKDMSKAGGERTCKEMHGRQVENV